MHPIVGLSSTAQASAFFGGKPTESNVQFKQRVNERLRHKARAVSAWDHERLILEHFPEIESVTCFANLLYQQAGFFPGNILIIVRLKVLSCDHSPCNKIHVSSNVLTNIQRFISSRCSEFVTLDVQNPIYESVQVRCSIKFKQGRILVQY